MLLGLWSRLEWRDLPETQDPTPLPKRALFYVRATAILGALVFAVSLAGWDSPDAVRYLAFLGLAVLASGMRISVPGLTGTLSLTFLFVLFGLLELTLSETVLMAAVMTLIQCYWRQPVRPRPAKVIFNVATMVIAAASAGTACAAPWINGMSGEPGHPDCLRDRGIFPGQHGAGGAGDFADRGSSRS